MDVSLTPELEQAVNEKVSSGLYHTADDVRAEILRRDLRAGFNAVARGECTDYDATTIPKLADRVKS